MKIMVMTGKVKHAVRAESGGRRRRRRAGHGGRRAHRRDRHARARAAGRRRGEDPGGRGGRHRRRARRRRGAGARRAGRRSSARASSPRPRRPRRASIARRSCARSRTRRSARAAYSGKPLRALKNPYIAEHEADPSKMQALPGAAHDLGAAQRHGVLGREADPTTHLHARPGRASARSARSSRRPTCCARSSRARQTCSTPASSRTVRERKRQRSDPQAAGRALRSIASLPVFAANRHPCMSGTPLVHGLARVIGASILLQPTGSRLVGSFEPERRGCTHDTLIRLHHGTRGGVRDVTLVVPHAWGQTSASRTRPASPSSARRTTSGSPAPRTSGTCRGRRSRRASTVRRSRSSPTFVC